MDPQSALIFPGDFMPGSRQNCIVKEMLIGTQCAINIYFSIASLSSLQFYNWILSCESFVLQTPWPPCYQLLVTYLDQWSFWGGIEIIWNVSYKKIRVIDQIIFSVYNIFSYSCRLNNKDAYTNAYYDCSESSEIRRPYLWTKTVLKLLSVVPTAATERRHTQYYWWTPVPSDPCLKY